MPTPAALKQRQDVLQFLSEIITPQVDVELEACGSIPLRTFLPDADVDIGVFPRSQAGHGWFSDIYTCLKHAEANPPPGDLQVSELQLIQAAHVCLIKLMVGHVTVDISANQLGSLRSVAFLEEIDQFFGRKHIFKRSLLLIKIWSYYEARMLGSHHALISSYALCTLVLYVFNIHGNDIQTPFQALYLFLQELSEIDWGQTILTVLGPVDLDLVHNGIMDTEMLLPSLIIPTDIFRTYCNETTRSPIMLAAIHQWEKNHPLSSNEDDETSLDTDSTSVPQDQKTPIKQTIETNESTETSSPLYEHVAVKVTLKTFNLLDPLNFSNNIGRSVSHGNMFRIQDIWQQALCDIKVMLSVALCTDADHYEDIVAQCFNTFFRFTLRRHGSGRRADMYDVATVGMAIYASDNLYDVDGNQPTDWETRVMSGKGMLELDLLSTSLEE
eukprot:TRINITY_DN2153_c0_g1_i1.p1 TRINITY_DN2153_c0_g1~~TRINITY_DN2153_c0_g1_i1.p1  ORF type:complete len:473 (+),score=88.94 TRINITY_DN2153_c0_g1_i1:95-1420(+)